MPDKPEVILVTIEQSRGWYIATSNDMANFFMAQPSMPELLADIPEVIRTLYKFQYGIDVVVKEGACGENPNPMPLRFVMEPASRAA